MNRVADAAQRADANRVRDWLARYEDVEMLLQIGEYERGNDVETDRAIDLRPAIQRFLQSTVRPVQRVGRNARAAAWIVRRRSPGVMRSAAQEARLWRLLVRVRGFRLRRKLRTLVDARRRERHAAAAVAEQVAALERHAEERQRVLAFCRRDQRAGGQWHATLRAHDARTS